MAAFDTYRLHKRLFAQLAGLLNNMLVQLLLEFKLFLVIRVVDTFPPLPLLILKVLLELPPSLVVSAIV